MTVRPTIQFYGGIGTIGGTKIIVQEGEYRVLFDFGLNYAPGGDYWGGKLHPREGGARLRDLLHMGYLPAVDGLYREREALALGLKPADDKTHVFISHLHLDHMAVVDCLADQLPVWMHQDSLQLFRAVAETGEPPAVPTGARGFQWHQPIQVGPIRVTPLPIDHDIPGASALLIETSSGAVVYSGDLRLHGTHPDLIEAFCAQSQAAKPRILLIEGTRLGEAVRTPDKPPSRTEPEVAPAVAKACAAAEGLALIALYPRNVARIRAIASAVRSDGRTLVLSAETAHIYRAMGGDLSTVALYQRERDRQALTAGSAQPWLRAIYTAGISVLDAEQIKKAQRQYLLQLYYWDLPELVDLHPQPGSIFLHSNGEPLGKFDPAFALFTRWLDRFGVQLLFTGSTGHAAPADLDRVVRSIAPEILMPIHSHSPELLEPAGIRRILPELGAHYDIATGDRLNK
jgi:ribonuclease J